MHALADAFGIRLREVPRTSHGDIDLRPFWPLLFNRQGGLDGTHDWGETHVCIARADVHAQMNALREEQEEKLKQIDSAVVSIVVAINRLLTESPSLKAAPNLLDTLLSLGEYTTIVDVIYNHFDRFGNLAGKLIENKMAFHRGPPSLRFGHELESTAASSLVASINSSDGLTQTLL